MKRLHWIGICLWACVWLACGGGDDQSTDPLSTSLPAFNAAKELKLPLSMQDSALATPLPKTSMVAHAAWKALIPDSAFTAVYGKNGKPNLYPLGKIRVKGGETYFFLRTQAGGKQAIYIVALDAGGQYSAAMPFVTSQAGRHTTGNMDSRYTITTLSKQEKQTQLQYSKAVYVYNTVGDFTLILTESNEQAEKLKELVNPLDTFPSTMALTGDYRQDKQNLVSFRDGKNPQQMQVFVHFEKNNQSCTGELKGLVRITAPNKAVFTESSSPCEIHFEFNGNTVRMQEINGCGSHRDIKCFFEGSYTRKPKPTPKKPKSKAKK